MKSFILLLRALLDPDSAGSLLLGVSATGCVPCLLVYLSTNMHLRNDEIRIFTGIGVGQVEG